MIKIVCDICGESRKFRSGIQGDYRLWFTTVELRQICAKGKELSCNLAVDICGDCVGKLLDGGREGLEVNEVTPVWDRFDDCLIRGIHQTLKAKELTLVVKNNENL